MIEFIPSIDFTKGTFKGVPLLYHDGYKYFRTGRLDCVFKQYGLHKYYLRHGDEGDFVEPVMMETKPIMVNYCGFILTKEDLILKFPESVVQIDFENYHAQYIIIEDEEEGYNIISDDSDDYADFLEFVGGNDNAEGT